MATQRKIPLPSRMVIKFMNVIYSAVYVLLKPLGLAPAFMALLSGGLFGLLLLPVSVLYGFLYVLREYCLPDEGVYHDVIIYSLWGWVFWYFWTIFTDDAHLRVEDTGFMHPTLIFDKLSYQFFLEIFNYFPMTCIPESDKVKRQLSDISKQYVVGVHPHGIHCFPLTMLASPGTPFDHLFPGLVSGSETNCRHPFTGLAATVVFKIPVVREFFLSFGYVDARRSVADAALNAGKSIFVVVGGEEESIYDFTNTHEDVLVLQNRKGFVRLALRHGAHLLPVFGINNADTFKTYSLGMELRRWIQKRFKIALPIFHGRFFTPLPYNIPITVVIGEPIETPKPSQPGAKPNEELVDEYHQKYIAALKKLHSLHVRNRPLRIV